MKKWLLVLIVLFMCFSQSVFACNDCNDKVPVINNTVAPVIVVQPEISNTNNNTNLNNNTNWNNNENKNNNANLNTNLNSNKVDVNTKIDNNVKVDNKINNDIDIENKLKQDQNQRQGQFQQNVLVYAPVNQREFPTSANVSFPGVVAFHDTSKDNGAFYVSILDIMKLKSEYTKDDTKALAKDGLPFFRKSPTVLVTKFFESKSNIVVVRLVDKIDNTKGKYFLCGWVICQQNSKVGTSFHNLGQGLMAAFELGGNELLLIGEGIKGIDVSRTLGIGGNFTIANQGEAEDTGRIGGSAIGVAFSKAEKRKLPYTIFAVMYYVE
jgi:hypothetical protein